MIDPTAPAPSPIYKLILRLPPKAPAVGAMLLCALLFGTSAVPAKVALERVPPFVIAEIRWVIAIGLILAILWRRGERPVINGWTWLLGLTGLALFYFFYSYGLRHTTAANATLISGGTPVLVALLATVMLGERMTRAKAIGIATSLAGVVAIVGAGTGLDASLTGNVLIVGSATTWAIYTVVGRKAFTSAGPLAQLAGVGIAGLILMAPLAATELVREGMPDARGTDWLLILYMGIGPSALGYITIGYGLSRLEASEAAVFGNLMPFIGAVAGYLFLDEQIGVAHFIGGALIILGVWAATRSRGVEAPREIQKGGGNGIVEQGAPGRVLIAAVDRPARGGGR